MRASLWLAESATANADRTVSMLRGGLDAAWSASLPANVALALVVRIELDQSEAGTKHELRVRLMDEKGSDLVAPFSTPFEVPRGGGNLHLVLPCQLQIVAYGRLVFHANVDGQRLASWPLDFRSAPPESVAGGVVR